MGHFLAICFFLIFVLTFFYSKGLFITQNSIQDLMFKYAKTM